MVWLTPKTDWKSTDYFTYEDWNRWVANVQELKKLACYAYPNFEIVAMPTKTINDFPYAEEINDLEQNMLTILSKVYKFVDFKGKTFYPNQPTLDFAEANKIESASLEIYNGLVNQINGKKRLAFTLGGGIF